jgi:uncharacterized protein YbjT (DUF2867 family)
MKEADYQRITYDLTLAAAQTLSRLNSGMTFIYVSGAGTDSTEQGRIMWARVKGRTENALLRLPLAAYMFRPGIIQPLDGIKSKTPSYRIGYALMKPLLPPLRWILPNLVLSTRDIGLAMLAVAKHGYEKRILESAAKLAINPAGEEPADRTYPVAVVVISGGRKSDRPDRKLRSKSLCWQGAS